MRMANSVPLCFTVVTNKDGVPGLEFERDPEEYTVDQLKRWLNCRGLKLNVKRDELLKSEQLHKRRISSQARSKHRQW